MGRGGSVRVAPCFSKPETQLNAVNLPTTLGLQAGVAPTTMDLRLAISLTGLV